MFTGSGITETHGDQRYFISIVKSLAVNTQPVAEVITTFIVPWNAGGMHQFSRGLANNDQPALGTGGNNGPGAIRKVLAADGAATDLL